MTNRKTDAPLAVTARVDEAWRSTAFLPTKRTAALLGVSSATIYAMHHRGEIELKRVGGRAVVPTVQVARLVDGAPAWTASKRGGAARARRVWLVKADCQTLTEVAA